MYLALVFDNYIFQRCTRLALYKMVMTVVITDVIIQKFSSTDSGTGEQ